MIDHLAKLLTNIWFHSTDYKEQKQVEVSPQGWHNEPFGQRLRLSKGSRRCRMVRSLTTRHPPFKLRVYEPREEMIIVVFEER